MQGLGNTIQNNALAALSQQAPAGVMSAIQSASAKTGVNFAYMLQQAAAESSFNPAAKAKTSSASGLYQFIESTWMNMVDKYGAKHGIETEGKSRKEILALRNDPKVAANMAAEFASENEKFLEAHWAKGQKEIGSTELYFAHFLGAGSAAAFLNARDENPGQIAAAIFPDAAKSNRNVFYDTKTGRAKTLDEVYAFFDKKFSLDDIKTAELQPSSNPPNLAKAQSGIRSSVFTNDYKARALGDSFIRSYAPVPYQALIHAPIEIMLLSQLDLPLGPETDSKAKSLF